MTWNKKCWILLFSCIGIAVQVMFEHDYEKRLKMIVNEYALIDFFFCSILFLFAVHYLQKLWYIIDSMHCSRLVILSDINVSSKNKIHSFNTQLEQKSILISHAILKGILSTPFSQKAIIFGTLSRFCYSLSLFR